MAHWLLKTEPETFGIDHLAACPGQTEPWDGVRNYQARNFMREMKSGDRAFLYHSNCKVPGIVGIIQVVRGAYPDDTALDPASPYFDPKASPDNPRWYRVDVRLVRQLARVISLSELKTHPELEGLQLLRRGNRLSVLPVAAEHRDFILNLEDQDVIP